MSAKANHLEQTCLQCRHLMVAVCRNVQNVPAEKYIFILQLCAFYACKKHSKTKHHSRAGYYKATPHEQIESYDASEYEDRIAEAMKNARVYIHSMEEEL